jgi:hypothetical protein
VFAASKFLHWRARLRRAPARSNYAPNKEINNKNMTTLLATVTAGQDVGGALVAGSTLYAVLCVIEFLIVMAFAVLWFVFPLTMWTKLNNVIKLLTAITKAGNTTRLKG